jgi:hypothetical protein
MNDPMNDDLDALLAPPPLPPEAAAFRQAVLERTTAVLRRRRRLKQVAWVCGLAACYVAGMLTMRWITPSPIPQVVEVQPEPKHEQPEPKKETAPRPLTAVAVENLALDSTENRAELYRQAAELYRQQGDYANWLRCKDNALDAAKKADLAVAPDDDFITIALKRDRQKQEKNDARHVD